ncbi:hypothetical protein NADE_000267 [Nannochloris sp. 'desiccata']|nr:hypothetical protein KSW81_004950 [Chlorella desiccata (nom. nud.)]KAH7618066.1 hypothetical protein NADE_000267 [Chlorella desiccata (nom. nud.)]
MDFLRRSLGLGRRLTTAAQAAPAGVEQASLAASDLKGKLLEDVNKIIKDNPSLRYVWAVGGAIIVGGSALYHKIHNVEVQVERVEKGLNEKIHNLEVQVERVEKGLNEKIHNVEVQVERVEKGLNEKIHSLEVELKGELHDQLGQGSCEERCSPDRGQAPQQASAAAPE